MFEGEADTRGAHGGRGSAKTRTFAKMTAVRAHMWDQAGRKGIILCARQFMNSLDDSSLEEIKTAIAEEEWLAPHFDIGEKYIRTKSGRISYSFAGLDRNIASIKGKSRLLLAWVEEAEPVTEDAWVKLEPTLREEDSELWVTWNPEREESATNKRFHSRIAKPDSRTKIVEMNWRDNPWFPDILERKRQKTKRDKPHEYEHIWEGEFVTAVEGEREGEREGSHPSPFVTVTSRDIALPFDLCLRCRSASLSRFCCSLRSSIAASAFTAATICSALHPAASMASRTSAAIIAPPSLPDRPRGRPPRLFPSSHCGAWRG